MKPNTTDAIAIFVGLSVVSVLTGHVEAGMAFALLSITFALIKIEKERRP